MATIATRLTDEQKESLIKSFLRNLGGRLKSKREKINLSQSELADCLSIERSTLSKYESGERDMNVSLLPLFSAYCKFPLKDLFPEQESRFILDSFSKAVTISVERKKRKIESDRRKALKPVPQDKVLVANIYKTDNGEVREPVDDTGIQGKSKRDLYKDAEMHSEYAPFNEQEFINYVMEQDEDLRLSLMDAGQFLMRLEDAPRKETLKGAVADYIIDELIINRVTPDGSDAESRMAYGYYRELYHRMMNDNNDYQ